MMRKPDVLLLDAGNTLVFLDHEALAEVAHKAGLSVSADALFRAEPTAKRAYEQGMLEGLDHEAGWLLHMRVIFEAAGLDAASAEIASKASRLAQDEFNLWRRVPPELPAALTRARAAGVRLGIISNAEGTLLALLERVDLARYFEHVIDSGLEGVRKPEPEIFLRGLARMGVTAERALYAGDIPQVDIDGARGVGMDAVLIDALDHYPSYTGAPRFASVSDLITAFGI